MSNTAPNRSVLQLEDELSGFIEGKRASDPDFAAAFEDSQLRHTILDKLVKCRRALGLTQKQVANRMGVTQPTVSGFETEASDPRLSTLQRYARAVECTVDFKLDMPAYCNWMKINAGPYQPVTVQRSAADFNPTSKDSNLTQVYFEDVRRNGYRPHRQARLVPVPA